MQCGWPRRFLSEGVIPDDMDDNWNLGHRVSRIDVEEKYLELENIRMTFNLDGMLYGAALRSKYPRARVLELIRQQLRHFPE